MNPKPEQFRTVAWLKKSVDELTKHNVEVTEIELAAKQDEIPHDPDVESLSAEKNLQILAAQIRQREED